MLLATSLKDAEKEQQEAFDKFISEGGKIAAERTQLEKQRDQKKAETRGISSRYV
jgi:DNA sulfur modification protein DndD